LEQAPRIKDACGAREAGWPCSDVIQHGGFAERFGNVHAAVLFLLTLQVNPRAHR
jgi:hypothetical protein